MFVNVVLFVSERFVFCFVLCEINIIWCYIVENFFGVILFCIVWGMYVVLYYVMVVV